MSEKQKVTGENQDQIITEHTIENKYKATLVKRGSSQVLIFNEENYYGSLKNFFNVMKKGQAQLRVDTEGNFNGTKIVVTDTPETYIEFEKRFDATQSSRRKEWAASPEGQSVLKEREEKEQNDIRNLVDAKVKFVKERDMLVQSKTRTMDTVKLFGEDWDYISGWYEKIQGTLKENISKNPKAKTVHDVENVDANMKFLFGDSGTAGRLEIADKDAGSAIRDAFWADLEKLFDELKKDSKKE